MSNREAGEADAGHLGDVPDGAGCFEIWAHLSEHRDEYAAVETQPDGSS